MNIRKLQRLDADEVWELRNAAILQGCAKVYDAKTLQIWTPYETPAGFAELVARGFYGIEIDAELVAVGMLDEDSNKIEGLFVLPSFMGQGLGQQLLTHLEQLAQSRRIKSLTLDASLNAVNFYQRCGYRIVRHETYHSPAGISLPSVLMEKSLK
ncbi:GNAT family N-acetyltransferase [Shewanella avicenniae]|uniref:GNAT family N-acetyltransferase n=1 Tax=Shewanella avicenniae TaxID=2814294 RepID=A0ABX7QNM9_9GAMM|nr:GNAT family N-acetyltransferase [Shewanella avicenniae]QSX33076.1 GNAT family N-acetyltransferase [Shewanella avicenniae]